MLKRPFYNTIITVLCILLVPYLFISYNHIGEDCFISFRYVENLFSGFGLVFNPGERVEGYSNFLWVMLLAFFRFFGLNIVTVSKILGFASMILILWIGSYYSLKKRQRKISWIYLATPLMIFFHPMLHYHAGRGLETIFYTMLMIWAAYSFKRRNYANSSIAFAAIALTRPEGFLYFWLILPMLFLDIKYSQTEKFPYPTPLIRIRFFVPYLVIVISFFAWRLLYYGHLFPNSVYAKTEPFNFWVNNSFHSLLQFVISWSYIPLFALLSLFTFRRENWEQQRSLIIPMIFTGGILLYTISVGEVQASPFRHYVPMIPFVIILFQEFLRTMKLRVEDNMPIIIGLFLIFQGMNWYTSTNLDHPDTRLHSRTIEFLKSWNFPARVKWVFEEPILINAQAGRWLDENIPHDISIGADQIGQLGYYAPQRIVDLLGLCDKEFARKGYSLDILLEKQPDYLAVMSYLGTRKPFLDPIAESFEKSQFKNNYKLRWILRPRNDINKTDFLIYVHREWLDPDAPEEPEIMLLGPKTEEWQEKLRID